MTKTLEPLARHHVHEFAKHPTTGFVLCRCGISEQSAKAFDPDYVTVCCGCNFTKREPITLITAESHVYCFACDRDDRPLIHHEQWQDAVCAACGQTNPEAGAPDEWTFHWRSATSGSLSAQSCGGECGRTVEALRDTDGILKRIPRSAKGRLKRGPRTSSPSHRSKSEQRHAA